MTNSIDEYLHQLRLEMVGCDKATIQDALSDTEEYLRNAVARIQTTQSGISEADALTSVLEKYGMPAEVAAGYHDIETRAEPYYLFNRHGEEQSWFVRYFGVTTDSRAWGALLYLLLSILTGIIYFGWMAAGISSVIGTLVYVVGIPLAGVFILSIRGLALIEGRFVETLLGIRMPRRPIFSSADLSLWGRFKSLILDRYTWSTMAYMLLQLPLGTIYFSLFALLIALSVWFIFQPLWAFIPGYQDYFLPVWAIVIMVPVGIFIFPATMQLARVIGKWHGSLAKSMLVRE
jgi:uncharacterized membrane protein